MNLRAVQLRKQSLKSDRNTPRHSFGGICLKIAVDEKFGDRARTDRLAV
jgi:hypothetical protein